MHQLLKLQDKLGFRLVLTGDTKQLSSVEAGKPFEQMLKSLPSVKINEIIRQKNDQHKEAVIASSEGKIKKTFDIHKDNIKEVRDEEEIAKSAARLFLAKTKTEREETLLISPTRKLRDAINNNIIEGLKDINQLSGQSKEITVLKTKDITSADYKFASSFNPGEILKFNKSYKNGIEKGDYLKIKKIILFS
jgi:ATP-dependent exoDNAse (exonuclease V) alpha subunit